MPNTAATRSYNTATSAATVTLEATTIINFLIEFFLNSFKFGILKKMLGALTYMQFIMVYSLLNIQFPANVVNFTSKLKSVVSFDVLKVFVTPLNKFLFTFDYKGEKTEKDKKMISPLKELNYQNTNCVLNLGLFGQLIAYYFFIVIVQYPVVYLLSEISDRFKPR